MQNVICLFILFGVSVCVLIAYVVFKAKEAEPRHRPIMVSSADYQDTMVRYLGDVFERMPRPAAHPTRAVTRPIVTPTPTKTDADMAADHIRLLAIKGLRAPLGFSKEQAEARVADTYRPGMTIDQALNAALRWKAAA